MAATASGELAGRARTAGGSRRLAFGLLVLANALWAGTYTAGKIALGALTPVELNALRFSLAALVLAPLVYRHRRELPLDRQSLLTLAQLTLLGWVLNKTFEYFGLALSTASDVALLISTESLFTALLSWAVLRERQTRTGLAALAIGLAGVYLIVERGLIPNLGGHGGSGRVAGDLLVILSLLLEAGYTIRGKSTLTRVSPLLLVGATLIGSLIVWVPAGTGAVLTGGLPHLTAAEWLAVLYMALIATVTGYWLWFHALSMIDASAAAPTLFIQPLLGAAIAIWLLHDALTWATLLGAALILVSLALVARGERISAALRAAKEVL
jgi:drug/metabolite transporter (DMT)-like permease